MTKKVFLSNEVLVWNLKIHQQKNTILIEQRVFNHSIDTQDNFDKIHLFMIKKKKRQTNIQQTSNVKIKTFRAYNESSELKEILHFLIYQFLPFNFWPKSSTYYDRHQHCSTFTIFIFYLAFQLFFLRGLFRIPGSNPHNISFSVCVYLFLFANFYFF